MNAPRSSVPFERLPVEWQEQIRRLRAENAKFRHQRNEAREALVALAMKSN